MSGHRLTLRQRPPLRLDLRGIVPQALAGLAPAAVERLKIVCGNAWLALGDCFGVEAADADGLTLAGDLSGCDRIGWQMAAGRLVVEGDAGHYAGALMSGGELVVEGRAGWLAACEMSGGTCSVAGDVGDFAASTLPGNPDGMRGGTFVVKGRAGARFGDRMRRGTAVLFGDAGDFLASRMVAGTIAVGGRVGAHAAYGMRRGSVVLAAPTPPAEGARRFEAAPTFVPAGATADVIWQLMARDLARHGGPFAGLAEASVERHLGDLAVGGKGEVIVVR